MNIKEYQELSIRTMNQDLTTEQTITNCLMGIQGETGEVADIFKKNFYQGHTLNLPHVHEEIGDVMFYLVNLASALGFRMEDILEANIWKLKKRYPDGFSAAASVARVDK